MPHAGPAPRQAPGRDTELRAAMRIRHVDSLSDPMDGPLDIDRCHDRRHGPGSPQTANKPVELQGKERGYRHVQKRRGVEQ